MTFQNFQVEHLTPMHKYRFRVKAVNKIGQSDAAEMTGDDILMKDPWGKFHNFLHYWDFPTSFIVTLGSYDY
jgi:hypothetical protein